MGFRCGWLAVRNVDPDAALEAIGLVREDESHEPVYDPGHYAVVLPGGWLVVIGDGWDALDTVQPRHARALSTGTEALHLRCDDTSMCATLLAYRDGERVWSVAYDGSGGVSAPIVDGEAPAVVRETVARCEDIQRRAGAGDVDHVYEAAPQIALVLTGFRHDQTLADGAHLPILVLARA